MAKKRTIVCWGTADSVGLYKDQSCTRLNAIAEHVHRYWDEPLIYARRNRLSERQKELWAQAKKIGIRVVKLRITYEVPE